jgi:hypothetical protein
VYKLIGYIIMLCVLFTAPIFAGERTTTRYYDERGKFIGKSETQKDGKSERFYDEKGKYTGKSETHNGDTRYYDEKGKYIGKSNELNKGKN